MMQKPHILMHAVPSQVQLVVQLVVQVHVSMYAYSDGSIDAEEGHMLKHRRYLELVLHPRGPLQQAHAFLCWEVTECAIQHAIGQQAREGLLALRAGAVVPQISPVDDALGCRHKSCGCIAYDLNEHH